ncbi:MAG TPA: ABC transporter substrate-binding protein [Gemmatimonadaceae bacterium]|nr:ABC transporter substrate-binding protein [Gemmatimonadaceae bacterium]
MLCSLALAGCQRDPLGAGALQLGAAGAWQTAYGEMAHRGIELAIEEINKQGGIDGRTFKVNFRDDNAEGGPAADIAREFVDDPRILGVIGHLSSTAMVAAARVYDGELPVLSPSATSPDLSGVSAWLFRLAPSDSMTGRTMGELARKQLGKRRVAVMYDNSSYGRGLVEPFLDGLGLAPIALEPIDPSGDSIDVNVRAIARKKPDLVFAVGTISGPKVLKALRSHGVMVPVIAGDGWSGIETQMEVHDVSIALPFSSDEKRAEVKRFVTAFRSHFGVDPDAYAALSYDAALAMARAAAKGRSRDGTRAVLATMNDTQGYTIGPVRFSASGDPAGRTMQLLHIDGSTRTFGVMQ